MDYLQGRHAHLGAGVFLVSVLFSTALLANPEGGRLAGKQDAGGAKSG